MPNFDIKEIVNEAVKNADHMFCDEEDFRIAIISEIEKRHNKENPLIITEYKYRQDNENTKKIDIYIILENKQYAVELKYRTNWTKKKTKKIYPKYLRKAGKNKSINMDIDVAHLNEADGILWPKDKNDIGAIVTWWKDDGNKYKYYIRQQDEAFEYVDDIDKMLNFVANVNNKCVAYVIMLSNHNWEYTINKMIVPDNKKEKTINKAKCNAKHRIIDNHNIQGCDLYDDFNICIYEIKK